ncbi:MAG TPA: M23 family metallopeptidase [Burkholderiaceae bacterium]|nr:M23 family metallopeptidase [Burkholderiaceae bacterium]
MNSSRLLLHPLLAICASGTLLGGCVSGGASPDDTPKAAVPEDRYTPLVAEVTTPSVQIVQGTDGKLHAVYEIRFANTRPVAATLQRVAVVDDNGQRSHASFEGSELRQRLRSLSGRPAEPAIALDNVRQLLVDLRFDDLADIPATLRHRIDLLAASTNVTSPRPAQQRYDLAPLVLDTSAPLVIGPPLRGTGWVAYNGCCDAGGAHRGAGLPVNGAVHFAQRFAIDWIRMNAQGRTVDGDDTDVHNYTAYAAEVIAVADGTVVDVVDDLDDQTPPKLPDPATITLQNVDGNHVTLDLGQGRYAFYAHLKKNSVAVRVGDRVTRGQVLGEVGNTGNTSAPHLHFHVMDSPSVLGSSGLPYVIDRFGHAGQVPPALAVQFDRSWSSALFAEPARREKQFPLDLSVIDF